MLIDANHPLAQTIEAMCDVVKAAGRRLLALQPERAQLAVTNKSLSGARDLVTSADLEIDSLLAQELPKIRHLPYVSEESGFKNRIESLNEPFWLADPIDGTNNFINGMPMYGTALALIEQGKAIAAVSEFPALGLCFYAVAGGGAWCGSRRLQVVENAPNDWVAEVSTQPQDADMLRNAMLMFSSTRAIRVLGSIALSLCWVAGGELDLFLGRGYAWDVAGGMLILSEAGGVCKTLNGEDRNPLKQQQMLAGHPAHVTFALAKITSQ